MRILDENNEVLDKSAIDYENGYLIDDTISIEHPAIEAVDEQWHYEVIAEYPNGGKDVKKVVDVLGVEGHEAYTETEEIKRYILYTEEELAERLAKRLQMQNTPTQLDRVEAQVMYTALMTDTLLEEDDTLLEEDE